MNGAPPARGREAPCQCKIGCPGFRAPCVVCARARAAPLLQRGEGRARVLSRGRAGKERGFGGRNLLTSFCLVEMRITARIYARVRTR